MSKRRPSTRRTQPKKKAAPTQFVDDQGNVQTLTPVEQQTGPLTVATVARIVAAQYGRTVVPPAVAATAAHAVPALVGSTPLIGLGGAALTGLTYAAGFRRPWWATAWAGAATTVATLHSAFGYERPLPLLTTALLAGLTGCWWLGHRHRNDTGTVLTLPERWATGVGAKDMKLPGSRIIPASLDVVPVGVRFDVQLVPGKQTTTQAIGAVEAIASGLSVNGLTVDVPDLVLEPTNPPSASRVSGLLVLNNPLHRVSLWGGPDRHDVDTWTSRVGQYVDLMPATYRWMIEGSGPVHDIIGGASRSGKSRFLDLLLAISRHAFNGLIVDWVADPQHGQSLPDWQGDAVDWFASGPDEVADMIAAALDFAEWRNRLFASMQWVDSRGRRRTGVKVMTPSVQHPLLVLTVDEASIPLADPVTLQRLEDLAKLASKSLVKVRLAQQAVLLDQMKSNTLRSQLQSQNSIWSFKTDAQNAQSGFQGWAVNPANIPGVWPDGSHTKGLGMTRADERQAFFRAHLVEDPYDWASTGTTTHLGDDWCRVAPATYLKARGLPIPTQRATTPAAAAGSAPAGPGTTQMDSRTAILRVLTQMGGRGTTAQIGQGVYELCGLKASTVSNKLTEMKGRDVRQPEGQWGVWELIQ
jgi:hypothetical protein